MGKDRRALRQKYGDKNLGFYQAKLSNVRRQRRFGPTKAKKAEVMRFDKMSQVLDLEDRGTKYHHRVKKTRLMRDIVPSECSVQAQGVGNASVYACLVYKKPRDTWVVSAAETYGNHVLNFCVRRSSLCEAAKGQRSTTRSTISAELQ